VRERTSATTASLTGSRKIPYRLVREYGERAEGEGRPVGTILRER